MIQAVRVSICILGIIATAVLPRHAKGAEERKGGGLTIGLIPEQNIFKQMDRYRPLAGYLSDKLGVVIQLTILSKYGDVIDRFHSRNMDGAFFEDFTTVIAHETLGVYPLVTVINRDGSDSIRGVIIVRDDGLINTVEDMRGKVAAFVDKASVSGYLFPRGYLLRHGVRDLDDFFEEIYFTGSNDAAVYSVLDGRADVASVKDSVLRSMMADDVLIGRELKIFAESPPLPNVTLCVGKNVPEETRTRMREILLAIAEDGEGRKVLEIFGARGFREANARDFAPVYHILREMGTEINDYDYRMR